jgi:ribonuclease HI
VFCDASERAIATVAYLRSQEKDHDPCIGFVIGKTKVAPLYGHRIPRLELCAAVLAVDISELATYHLGIKLDDIKFYSDSKVVLRYINNQTRKLFIYVSHGS